MEDRIDELKKLITTLEENSPLRKQLEEALAAEMERNADGTDAEAPKDQTTSSAHPKEEQPQNDESSSANETETPKSDDGNEQNDAPKGGKKSSNPFDGLDTIAEKLENLMEDEEFITASAGFVLGAAAVGLCVLGLNVLKK